ncbi:hypothetical protein FHS00_002324 [Limimaricola variabilis]|jgi:hypothetical protein|uniref:Uncharacterized protein n=1 Tax=Limimaricola variabilis TaxID=1492771 RepID=A0ABR6HQ94_9RHOB|nr:hypothetical protein [Limimaricola variabilis]MBB3712729.1 hypothetical protein [Limimaricola variabilis]WPY93357.1 hypothetical protein T8T21_09485 [Limimaricola variabilis]
MQMLCQIDTPDYASWKTAFDGDYEERMQAGLSQLQIWRDADHGSTVLVLFKVNDRKRAEAWIAKEQGFGGAMTCTFLETA